MPNIEMEEIDSSLISHRGHDANDHILAIRFKTKTGVLGSLYHYGNVSPELYEEGLVYQDDKGKISFGQWFNRTVKIDPKRYPFQKIEEVGGAPVNDFDAVKPATRSIGSIGRNPSASKTCEEASTFSNGTYMPCGKPSHAQVFHKRDNKTYAMCAGCANHNISNRGGEEISATTDFASGQPLPASTAEVLPPIPADPEELKAAALKLQDEAKAITINSADACETAMRTGMAIARMQDALEKTMRPAINEKHKAWKADLAILNYFNDPLEEHKMRLKKGITAFRQEQQRIADAESRKQREEAQRLAEAEARQRAEQLKLDDAVEAEQRGEPELAESILAAPALPLAPAYVPPVFVPTNVPDVKGAWYREKWVVEYVDENGRPSVDAQGNPVPRMDLIPMEYHLPDEKTLNAIAGRLKGRTAIPGIRAYDAGNVAFSKK